MKAAITPAPNPTRTVDTDAPNANAPSPPSPESDGLGLGVEPDPDPAGLLNVGDGDPLITVSLSEGMMSVREGEGERTVSEREMVDEEEELKSLVASEMSEDREDEKPSVLV